MTDHAIAFSAVGSEKNAEQLKYPCSLQQMRFWANEHLRPGDSAQNAAFRWRLDGRLCASTLEGAFQALIRRHEAFRTALVEEAFEPIQCIFQKVPFTIPIIDLSLLKRNEALDEAERLSQLEALTPFSLTEPPLIRAKLLTLSAQQSILLVTVHQSIADGWSIGILARELAAIYSAISADRTPDLQELPLTYADFAVWQRDWARGPDVKAAAESFRSKYAGAKYFELPNDKHSPQPPSISANIVSLLIDKALGDQINTIARTEGATFFMAAMTAVLTVLYQYSGETDLCIGTQLAGREEVELEHIIGYFANTLILPANAGGDPSFIELLGRVRDLVLDAFDNQHLPYESLIEILRLRPRPGRTPIYSVNFMVQRAFVSELTLGEVKLVGLPSVSPGAMYDLSFFLVERAEGWRLSCEYKTDLFEEATVIYLLEQIVRVMEIAAQTPRLEISRYFTGGRRAVSSPEPVNSLRRSDKTSLSRQFTESEQHVAEIWANLLGAGPTSPQDDFFDLGGDFWLALRFVRHLGDETGRSFTVTDLIEHPTAEAFANYAGEWFPDPDHSEIFTLQNGSVEPPIIILNMILPTRFVPLLRHLGPGRSVYGVQLFDITRPETFTCKNYDDLSARYVKLIRKIQPRGPYALLGWCAGGVLAYAVAEKLEREGEDVLHLSILDVWGPGYQASISPARARLISFLSRIRQIKERIEQDALAWRAKRITLGEFLINAIPGRIRRRFLQGSQTLRSSRQDAVDYSSRLLDYLRGLAAVYKGSPIRANISVFLSKAEASRSFLAKDRGWKRLARGDFELEIVPGNHFTLLDEPNVGQIADFIKRSLDEASDRSTSQR